VEQLRQAIPLPEKSSRLPGIVLLQLCPTTLMLLHFACKQEVQGFQEPSSGLSLTELLVAVRVLYRKQLF
jgi:hypothetical protein